MTTSRLDWEQARRRLERARHALTEERSPERERAVLAERARALAVPHEANVAPGSDADVVVFSLCGERFAVDAGHVIEAFELDAPTPVPGTAERLVGVVNHRGSVLGVFDLRPLLVADGTRDAALTHAVAVTIDGLTFAIAAEAVEETRRERASANLTVLDLDGLAADARLRIDDE
jgi:chemotaxis signal transduction protein